MEGFSLQTENPEVKDLYARQATEVQKVLNTTLPYLK
ncbi:DUF1657 domain-containing protein [Oceanobacillus timonensis]|nr:DUF1657 domain-containing protein [Oceanobacillus timonensis]